MIRQLDYMPLAAAKDAQPQQNPNRSDYITLFAFCEGDQGTGGGSLWIFFFLFGPLGTGSAGYIHDRYTVLLRQTHGRIDGFLGTVKHYRPNWH